MTIGYNNHEDIEVMSLHQGAKHGSLCEYGYKGDDSTTKGKPNKSFKDDNDRVKQSLGPRVC
jgi:hypothetical protein